MNWLLTLSPSSVPLARLRPVVCWILWQLSQVSGQVVGQPPEATASKPNEEVALSGSLAIGQFSYTVSGKAVLGPARVHSLDLTVRSGPSLVAAIELDSRPGGDLALKYAGQVYPLPAEHAVQWARVLRLTSRDLDGMLGFAKQAGKGARSWESVSAEPIRPGLPAKVRFVFKGSGQDEQGATARPIEVVVWSLSEWNNCFDENVVLRLKLLRGGSHDQ